MDTTNLKVYLPFDESATQDLCGNEWTAVGTPTISDGVLNLSSGTSYIYTSPPELGTSDFTIDWWEYISSTIDTLYADTICIDGATGNSPRAFGVHFPHAAYPTLYVGAGTGGSWLISGKRIGNKIRDEWVHRAIVRSGNTIYAFENGTLYTSVAFSQSINVSTSILSIGGLKRDSRRFRGRLDNIRFFVGTALWTENFTPPTENDYVLLRLALAGSAPITLNCDVERKLKKTVELTVDVERQIRGCW